MHARTILMVAFLVLALSSPALAQVVASPDTLESFIVQLYDSSVRIVGLAAFVMLLYAGVIRMIPGKNPSESNRVIVDVIIGTILLLSSVLILKSINPSLIKQDRPIFDRSRYESIDIKQRGAILPIIIQ